MLIPDMTSSTSGSSTSGYAAKSRALNTTCARSTIERSRDTGRSLRRAGRAVGTARGARMAPSAMGSTAVVIADDDVLLREGIARLLEPTAFDVVGLAGDADELLRLVRERRPQLVVLDIRMPPTHTTEGLDAARTIRTELPDV